MPIEVEFFGGGSGPTTYSALSATDPATDVTGAELEELTDGSTTALHAHGASGLPQDDTSPLVRDPVDNTKLAGLDAGNIATGTTRRIFLPNEDITLVDDATSDPLIDGVAADGTESSLARKDHVHPAHHTELHAAAHADAGGDELAVQDLASDAAVDGQVAKADGAGGVDFEDDDIGVNFIIDGGGSVITTGVKGYLELNFAGVFESVRLLADQSGSIVVDIWKDTYANYPPVDADSITASAVPTITTANKSEDTTLTGWTTTFAKGDILGFNVDSVTTIERLTVALGIRRT